MSVGIRALRHIQLVKETTHGTQNSTATAILIGKLEMTQDQKYYRPEDMETGRLSSVERSYIVGEQAKLVFEADANYQQICYILGMGIKGGVTGTGTASTGYTYTYLPNLASANNVDTYTMQYGDNVQAFQSGFCFAQDFEISGSIDSELKVKANIVAQNVRTGTFTAALANPTPLDPIITGTCKLYNDSTWAGLGTSQVSGTMIDFSYKVTTGITPVKYADGNIYFTDMAEKKRHIELDMTMAFTASTASVFASYIASPQTKNFLRIKSAGPTIGTTTNAELDLDGAFIVDTYGSLGERDGQDIVKVKWLSQWDSTASTEWQAIVRNSVVTLP